MSTYSLPSDAPPSVLREDGIEYGFIGKLQGLKYEPSGARQTGPKASPQGAVQHMVIHFTKENFETNMPVVFQALTHCWANAYQD